MGRICFGVNNIGRHIAPPGRTKERMMSWTDVSRVRNTMAKGALAGALVVVAATGSAGSAIAMPAFGGTSIAPVPLQPSGPPTGPDDPRCISQPTNPVCQGGPYAPPPPQGASVITGPADPACVSQPANPICAGGPYALPTPPLAPPPPPPPPMAPVAPIAPPPMAPVAPPPMAPVAPIAPPPMAPMGMGGMPGDI